MAIIRQDFTVLFEVQKIGSIKAWKETKIDGITYPPSVKFRATNITEQDDPDVGVREIETIIDFQITVENLNDVRHLVEAIKKKKDNKEKISILSNLPKKGNADDITKVKNIETLEQFVKRNNMVLGK